MDENPSRDLGLAEILEAGRPVYESELARQTEIAERARKIGLIFGQYMDIMRQLRGTEGVTLDNLRLRTNRPDLEADLQTLVSEGILTENKGIYQPSEFAHPYVQGKWGVLLRSDKPVFTQL